MVVCVLYAVKDFCVDDKVCYVLRIKDVNKNKPHSINWESNTNALPQFVYFHLKCGHGGGNATAVAIKPGNTFYKLKLGNVRSHQNQINHGKSFTFQS